MRNTPFIDYINNNSVLNFSTFIQYQINQNKSTFLDSESQNLKSTVTIPTCNIIHQTLIDQSMRYALGRVRQILKITGTTVSLDYRISQLSETNNIFILHKDNKQLFIITK